MVSIEAIDSTNIIVQVADFAFDSAQAIEIVVMGYHHFLIFGQVAVQLDEVHAK